MRTRPPLASSVVPCRRRAMSALVCVILASACTDYTPLQPDPRVGGVPAAAVYPGSSVVSVYVADPNGAAVDGAVVTLVHPVEGPIRTGVTAGGVATFSDLARGILLFAHARPGIDVAIASEPIFPPAAGFSFANVATTLAPALTGKSGKSVPVSYDNYKAMMARPPIRTGNTAVSVTIQLAYAGSLVVQPMDLGGAPVGGVTGGAVVPFGSCADFPWLAMSPDCLYGSGPAFLQAAGYSALALTLAVQKQQATVVDLLDSVSGQNLLTGTHNQGPFDLTATLPVTLDPLLCKVNSLLDATGDGTPVDIQGYVHYGMQMDYTPTLVPRYDRFAYWWEQTMADGPVTMSFGTRTTTATGPSNLTFFVDFEVNGQVCTVQKVWGTGTSLVPAVEASVFCRMGSNGLLRVTVLQAGVPTDWTKHEFNVKTTGESTYDPQRDEASRAWIAVPRESVCTVPGSNDGRWSVDI